MPIDYRYLDPFSVGSPEYALPNWINGAVLYTLPEPLKYPKYSPEWIQEKHDLVYQARRRSPAIKGRELIDRLHETISFIGVTKGWVDHFCEIKGIGKTWATNLEWALRLGMAEGYTPSELVLRDTDKLKLFLERATEYRYKIVHARIMSDQAIRNLRTWWMENGGKY